MSRASRIRIAAIGVAALGVWILPQGAADAATFGASWQMNETSGLATDSSGNGNAGTLHGGIVRTGGGYHFDGKTGYVSVPSSASLNPGSADFTMTAKFTLDAKPASGKDYDLVRKGVAGTSGGEYKMEVLSSGQASCRWVGTNGVTLNGGSNLGTGTHTVSCIKTSNSVKLVVDGTTKASRTVTVGPISNTKPVDLGAKPGDDWTKGLIDLITLS